MRRAALQLAALATLVCLLAAVAIPVGAHADMANVTVYDADGMTFEAAADIEAAVERGTIEPADTVLVDSSLVVAVESAALADDIDRRNESSTDAFFDVLENGTVRIKQTNDQVEIPPKRVALGPANATVYRRDETTFLVLEPERFDVVRGRGAYTRTAGFDHGDIFRVEIGYGADEFASSQQFETVGAPASLDLDRPNRRFPTETVEVGVDVYIPPESSLYATISLESGRVITKPVRLNDDGEADPVQFDLGDVPSGSDVRFQLIHDGSVVDRANGTVIAPVATLRNVSVKRQGDDLSIRLDATLSHGGAIYVRNENGTLIDRGETVGEAGPLDPGTTGRVLLDPVAVTGDRVTVVAARPRSEYVFYENAGARFTVFLDNLTVAGAGVHANISAYHAGSLEVRNASDIEAAIEAGRLEWGSRMGHVVNGDVLVLSIESARLARDLERGIGPATACFFGIEPLSIRIAHANPSANRNPIYLFLGPRNTTVYRAGTTTYLVVDTENLTTVRGLDQRNPSELLMGEIFFVTFGYDGTDFESGYPIFTLAPAVTEPLHGPEFERLPPERVHRRLNLSRDMNLNVRFTSDSNQSVTPSVRTEESVANVTFDLRALSTGTRYTMEIRDHDYVYDRITGVITEPRGRILDGLSLKRTDDGAVLVGTVNTTHGGRVTLAGPNGTVQAAVAIEPGTRQVRLPVDQVRPGRATVRVERPRGAEQTYYPSSSANRTISIDEESVDQPAATENAPDADSGPDTSPVSTQGVDGALSPVLVVVALLLSLACHIGVRRR